MSAAPSPGAARELELKLQREHGLFVPHCPVDPREYRPAWLTDCPVDGCYAETLMGACEHGFLSAWATSMAALDSPT